MKKFMIYAIALFLIPSLLFTGCKKDDEETFDAQKELTSYLVAQDMDLNKILDAFVMKAPDGGVISGMYIMDIRSADEFAAGHIEGAHHVTLANILTEAENAGGQPILVVCKTGQTATYASTLLRLSGFNSKALKWGMSSWNTSLDAWTPNVGNVAEGHSNWTNDAAPTNLTFASPKFTSTATNGADILKERVAAVLAGGFATATATDVIENPANYFINNYFSEADYLGFGHIAGAYRINPLLVSEGQVNFLDPSKPVITYCYTGQTSGAITAYLRVLGYDAKSLMFGMNKLSHDNSSWTSNRWDAGAESHNYPLVTGN
jgi:rhodanese-related sulfurtransferase